MYAHPSRERVVKLDLFQVAVSFQNIYMRTGLPSTYVPESTCQAYLIRLYNQVCPYISPHAYDFSDGFFHTFFSHFLSSELKIVTYNATVHLLTLFF